MMKTKIVAVFVVLLSSVSSFARSEGLECKSVIGRDVSILFTAGDPTTGMSEFKFDFPWWTGGDVQVSVPYDFTWNSGTYSKELQENIWVFRVSTSLYMVVEKDDQPVRRAILYNVKTYGKRAFRVGAIEDRYDCVKVKI